MALSVCMPWFSLHADDLARSGLTSSLSFAPGSPIWESCELTHPAQRLRGAGRGQGVLRWSAVVR